MRSTLILLAAVGRSSAAWLRWTGDSEPTWKPAQETGSMPKHDQVVGWTPRPTPAPGARPEGEVVLDLLKRASYTTTNWTNPETCGWFSGSSSYPWTCDQGATCATNDEHAVACASGTYSPLYVSCFDYAAFEGGSCSDVDSATGCCQNSQTPACGTYIWTGSPVRSMFRCFTSTTIISMLDEPQFVIDASISASLSSASAARASSESAALASAIKASTTTTSTTSSSTASSPAAPIETTTSSVTTNNIGAIVGGVVGGLGALLAILLLIFCCCMRKRRKGKNANYKVSYKNQHKENTRVYNSRREGRHEGRKKNATQGTKTRNGPGFGNGDTDEAYQISESKSRNESSLDEPSAGQYGSGETIVFASHVHYHMTEPSGTVP